MTRLKAVSVKFQNLALQQRGSVIDKKIFCHMSADSNKFIYLWLLSRVTYLKLTAIYPRQNTSYSRTIRIDVSSLTFINSSIFYVIVWNIMHQFVSMETVSFHHFTPNYSDYLIAETAWDIAKFILQITLDFQPLASVRSKIGDNCKVSNKTRWRQTIQ